MDSMKRLTTGRLRIVCPAARLCGEEITDDDSYASQLPASYHAIPARDIHRKCGQLIEHEPFWC